MARPCSAAARPRTSQSSTRSQGMWMATVGLTPVSRWTMPASASFSQIVRAAPGWAKTLNRVPEFPYPQDGVSTRRAPARSRTRSTWGRGSLPSPEEEEGGERVRGRGSLLLSVKVEDLWEQLVESGLGQDCLLHDPSHVSLPALAPLVDGEGLPEDVEVLHLQVGEQLAAAHEDRVVGAAGVLQGPEHLRPHRLVAAPVLGLLSGPHAHHEPDPLHRSPMGNQGEARLALRLRWEAHGASQPNWSNLRS